eukprot:4291275-Amphidinium_carterae.1
MVRRALRDGYPNHEMVKILDQIVIPLAKQRTNVLRPTLCAVHERLAKSCYLLTSCSTCCETQTNANENSLHFDFLVSLPLVITKEVYSGWNILMEPLLEPTILLVQQSRSRALLDPVWLCPHHRPCRNMAAMV